MPDEDDFEQGRIDLRSYYAAHGRYACSMYLVFLFIWAATGMYFALLRRGAHRLIEPYFHAHFSIPLLLTLVALLVERRWQAVILGLLLVHELAIAWNLFGLRG